eukprot:Selendium_serpulae@DN6446_c4_g2_i2.p1
MSTLKHSIKRRVHLERAQPESRQDLGLLEKKKDYSIRAKAFHEKAKIIRELREAARCRNEDEFNYGMLRSKKSKDGKLVAIPRPLSDSQNKRIAMQDKSILTMKKQIRDKRLDARMGELHFLRTRKVNTHTLFDTDGKETNANSNPLGSDKSSTLNRYKEVEANQTKNLQRDLMEENIRTTIHLQNKKERTLKRIDDDDDKVVYKWKFDRKK